ncbi:sensor histidine kinase [Cohnella fermenti]|uniref:Heme sensor protein HssS n=1 Tax=Cohnella fermenti TaxID=2565925 RepID=A0A4V3WGA4_9BACL|nr:HAMP domain-containing sensor histidine kinase [Cohnella fermenti]THF83465.1 HAMP domain-containing histidine kinase [Cohnella fermenti]
MRSLYTRVLLVTIYAIAISSFLGFYCSNLYYNWDIKKHYDEKLYRIAEDIRSYVQQYPETLSDYLDSAASMGYQIYLLGSEGSESLHGGDFKAFDLSADAKASVLGGGEYHGVAESENHFFKISYFDNRLSNTVGLPVMAAGETYALFMRSDTRLNFQELEIFFSLMFALTVLLSIPYFLLSTRYLVEPITRLTEATKRIASGNFDISLPTMRKDEIGQLASHYEKMARKLESSDRAKREFVANVSHEIQSPLASIQGFADSLLEENLPADDIRRYASIIGQESRQLAELSRQLLLLSSLENASEVVNKRSFALQPQLRRSLQLLEWQLSEKEIAVHMRVPASLLVVGDEVLLMQVWSNLLSNAVKHIPEGRSIEIVAAKEHGFCSVAISDTGDGIDDESLPFIFDRFFRGDQARQRGEGSTGLGLSIVRRIVLLHGGTIEVESKVGEGTTFRVRIPNE